MLVWRKKKLWLVANGIRTKLELTAPAVSGFRLHNRTLADRLPSAHQQGCLLLLRLFQKIQNMELNITNIDARFEFLPSLSVYHPLITKVRLPISTNSTVFKKKNMEPDPSNIQPLLAALGGGDGPPSPVSLKRLRSRRSSCRYKRDDMGVEPKIGGKPPKWMVFKGKPY